MKKNESRSVSQKTNLVLRVFLVALFLILFRIWHLSVLQRDEKLAKAQNSQKRTYLLRANRGTISDRYLTPLALNRICYNAAIYYSQISQIPAASWRVDQSGERKKIFPRKEYIKSLSQKLAMELNLDAERLEDEIHSKASLFPHAPYLIKTNLSETEHSRLCQLERDWPGLHAEIASERFYPLGKVAADLIGTMGLISAKEYRAIAEEINLLEQAAKRFEEGFWEDLPEGFNQIEDVYRRLYELREKAYTFSDRIGKTGIEAQFERELRGFFGKKSIEVNQKGLSLRELPSSYPSIAGQQVVLSISAELQQFAEQLLIQDEKAREGRSIGLDPQTKTRKRLKQPWIKGGAIVAIDPNTGEVLAMASHPRFDPNDFIMSGPQRQEKRKKVERWLETETFIADVWDGKQPLTRERMGRSLQEESLFLTWDVFLDQILPDEGPLRDFFRRYDDIKSAIELQEDFELALYLSKESDPKMVFEAMPKLLEELKSQDRKAHARIKKLDLAMRPLASSLDKLFAIDLARLVIYSAAFSDELIASVGSMKLSTYFSLRQMLLHCEEEALELEKKVFHEGPFKRWKAEFEKEFLAAKRLEELEKKTYARPYLDYLDQEEKKQFAIYWADKRLDALSNLLLAEPKSLYAEKLQRALENLKPELRKEWLKTFRSYQELDRPLLAPYKRVRKPHLEKHLAASFYPIGGYGFSRSYSFQAASPPGSVFKLVTAYTALSQQIAPFSMIDEQKIDRSAPPSKSQIVGYTPQKVPYYRHYKGGRLPKSHSAHIGKVDLVGALEASSNPYFSILAGDFFSDPEDLASSARLFGFGEKTGIDLPNEAKGALPTDLKTNRTGLYSFAIGQHTALATPLQVASMLATLASHGRQVTPRLTQKLIGPIPDRSSLEPFQASHYFAKEELNALGIPFPLFTAAQERRQETSISKMETTYKRNLPFPAHVRDPIFEGMEKAVWGSKGSARAGVVRGLLTNPLWMRDYLALASQMLGKTSTAEIAINLNINPSSPACIYKHIWFGAIALAPGKQKKPEPELVVVVFLRYGDGGKEAAPIASQIIHKWREIRAKHEGQPRK